MGNWGKVIVMYMWLLCRIFLERISCRVLENVFLIENGLNIGVEKVSEPMCSYGSFEGDIYDN